MLGGCECRNVETPGDFGNDSLSPGLRFTAGAGSSGHFHCFHDTFHKFARRPRFHPSAGGPSHARPRILIQKIRMKDASKGTHIAAGKYKSVLSISNQVKFCPYEFRDGHRASTEHRLVHDQSERIVLRR
jgi:hypothetical protein